MLHLAIADRNGHWRTLRFPVHEVVKWLHPDGWANRRRDWERFPAALDRMRQNLAYLYIRGVGDVAWLFPSVVPRTPDAPFVEFTIRIPKGAAIGSRLDWGRLCRYGTRSAGLYRAYLSAVALMDRSAHKGMAVTREIHAPLLLPTASPGDAREGLWCAPQPS